MARLTPEQIEEMRRLREAGVSYRETAEQVGCSAAVVGDYFPDSYFKGGDQDADSDPAPLADDESRKVTEKGDVRTIEAASRKEIRTLEDAVAFAEVDTSVWRVKEWGCTAWEVGMRMRGGSDEKGIRNPDTFERHGLWRVSLKLERIFPRHLMDATDAIFKRLESKAVRFDRPRLSPRVSGGSLIEINIPDLHMGKLAWAPETGHNYDMRIAESVYDDAVCELQQRAKGFDVDQAVFLIGSDFFHIDTLGNTTTAGTPQDMDGRYAKMIEVGEMAVIRAVDRLADACRQVHVVWVPGNHDRLSSYHLARTVAAWFRNDDRVTVDYSPSVRKYVRYGVNLLGYTHGDKIKREKLPLIMATERKRDWAETTWREFKTGHLHGFGGIEINGVRVRTSPSLCGTDAWHCEKGYIGNTRAAEAFIYDKDHGNVAAFTAVARN